MEQPVSQSPTWMSFLLGTATRVSKECWANVAFFLCPSLAQQLLHDVHSLLRGSYRTGSTGLNHFRFASLKERHVPTIRPLSRCASFHWIHSTPGAVWIVSLARATVNDPSCDPGRMSWLARKVGIPSCCRDESSRMAPMQMRCSGAFVSRGIGADEGNYKLGRRAKKEVQRWAVS